MEDEEFPEETLVIVPARGADNEEIIIGPLALDDCDNLGSSVRHRWPSGDGEGQYVQELYPEHLDGVRNTLIDLATLFYCRARRDDGYDTDSEARQAIRQWIADELAKGVDPNVAL